MSKISLKKIEGNNWQGEIASKYDDPNLRQALNEIQQLVNSPEARLLMEGRNRLIILNLPISQHGVMEVVVKEFRPRGLVKLRSLIVGSKARRSFYGALNLKRQLVNTPEPVAYIENRSRGRVQIEYFLAARIKEAREIRFYFQNYHPEQLDLLLQQLAAFIREMHERRIFHRDLSDGNILVKEVGVKGYEFFLLDPNRVRIKRIIRRGSRIKNLIRLGIPPSKQRFFLKSYFKGEKFSAYDWLWYCLNKRIFTLWIKIKKWLHLRALARCLRLQ